MLRLLLEAFIGLAVEETVRRHIPKLLRHAWMLICCILTWELMSEYGTGVAQGAFEMAKGKNLVAPSYLIVAVLGAVLFTVYWWGIGKGLAALAPKNLDRGPEVKKELSLSIRMLNGGQMEAPATTAWVRMIVQVYNSGSVPTIAKDWSLTVSLKGESKLAVVKYFAPNSTITMESNHAEQFPDSTFNETDAVYKKAAASPIQIGAMVEGPIQFEIEKFDSKLLDENSEFSLSVADLWGNRYSTKTTTKELNALPPQMFPTLRREQPPAKRRR